MASADEFFGEPGGLSSGDEPGDGVAGVDVEESCHRAGKKHCGRADERRLDDLEVVLEREGGFRGGRKRPEPRALGGLRLVFGCVGRPTADFRGHTAPLSGRSLISEDRWATLPCRSSCVAQPAGSWLERRALGLVLPLRPRPMFSGRHSP